MVVVVVLVLVLMGFALAGFLLGFADPLLLHLSLSGEFSADRR